MVKVILILTFFGGYGITSETIEIEAPTTGKAMETCLHVAEAAKADYTGGAEIDFVCVPMEE